MSEPNEFIKTMLSRRAVRHYTGAPVRREDMIRMIQAGMSAPSYKDARHRYFIVVDNPVLVQKLAEGLPFSKMLLTARHAIVVASDQDLLKSVADTDYWIQGCALAAENILLAAHSMGIATCWTAAHPRPERVAFVKKMLGMPDHVQPLCVIAVGYGTGEERPRDKFEQGKIFWNLWGQGI